MAGFQNRIFDKGQSGFLGGIHAQLGLSNDIQSKIFQQRGQLAHFPGVTGGENNFLHH
jgi:hypothetical protein